MEAIRKANKNDIPTLIELLTEVKKIHYKLRSDLFSNSPAKYDEASLLEFFNNDKTPFFVFDRDGIVLGYAFCKVTSFENSPNFINFTSLYIDDLGVSQNARRQYIGTKLYNFVLEYAKSIDCYNVTLNVWAQNKDAIAFYKKIGMTEQRFIMEKIVK